MRIDARTASSAVCAVARIFLDDKPFSSCYVTLVDSDLGIIQRLRVEEIDGSGDGICPIDTFYGDVRIELPDDLRVECPRFQGMPKLRHNAESDKWQIWTDELMAFEGDALELSRWAADPKRAWLVSRIEAPILGIVRPSSQSVRRLAADALNSIDPEAFKREYLGEFSPHTEAQDGRMGRTEH